jgi:hypothetical protein
MSTLLEFPHKSKPAAGHIDWGNPLSDGLQLWWGGESLVTRSAHGLDAVIGGTIPHMVVGGIQGAEVSAATGEYLSWNYAKPASTQLLSISFRARTGTCASLDGVFCWANNQVHSGPFLAIIGNGTIFRYYINSGYQYSSVIGANETLSTTLTWDGTSWRIYVSGQLVSTYSVGFGVAGGAKLHLGSAYNSASEGAVYDYLGYWHRVLSAREVETLHRAPYSIYRPKRVLIASSAAPPAGARPQGPFGHPFHGPFAGPIGA